MDIERWFVARGPRFIWQRGTSLLGRYGLLPRKAIERIDASVQTLAGLGCAPTFPTPAAVVECYPEYFRRLQAAGCEIAVHGYQHVDLSALPLAEAVAQLERAVQVFQQAGLEAHGFRCPYTGCNDALIQALPPGLFEYSSNSTVRWELTHLANRPCNGNLYAKLDGFYQAQPASQMLCLPRARRDLLEIPLCVPDDLQLHDGLHLRPDEIAEVWAELLRLTHQRGELLTLLSHPELAAACDHPLASLLQQARQLRPVVWIARLIDITSWWREKAQFRVDLGGDQARLRIAFICTSRATILARGLGPVGSGQLWDEHYYRLPPAPIDVPALPRPFVGVPAALAASLVPFLESQGYIVDTSDRAPDCGVFLDSETLRRLATEVQLIQHIEASSAPLVRYGRWPDGAMSALSITGDLDALTLLDYGRRLLPR